ncbi:sugar ABC transporter ATP-binding protein [Actinoplanes sp. LDG1-06]|uniref:Sugar ABC transporter ATP-binding protein n=1 Tax=Paractinoplanes ovalisporus TaxID=2810368 RepID=A0ABS2AEM7_9ACTN|nr:sugar ABC transporter ATP-binding protein [Actinoplanes ovalisporus]MBM2618273.1 sugar ABC transporter ATP-binding protein [Actinoplanes ovalisporus]
MTDVTHEGPLLEMRGVTKSFRGARALDDATMTVGRNQIRALIGQNGAGKSTLIKILTGVYRRDGGEVRLDGNAVDFRSTADAQKAGVVTIYQEVNLVPKLSVAENIFLGRFPRRRGFVDWATMRSGARDALAKLSLDIDVTRPLGSYRVATQQMTAIARAVSLEARLLVLDEPTSSLAEREVETLFGVMRSLRDSGVSMVFVSHRMDELYEICEDVTVLRDGRTVAEESLATLNQYELVSKMLGRAAEQVASGARTSARPKQQAEPVLAVSGAASAPRLRDASLAVYAGQVQGVAGLLGSGRSELLRSVFGADPLDAGEIKVNGRTGSLRTPGEAIAARVAFLTEDRRAEGIVPHLSVRDNLTLALLPKLTKRGIVDRKRQRQIVTDYIARLGIKAQADQPIVELSGGNQQKVLLARWLATEPAVLLLDEPTRGIDVSAKAEILALVDKLAADGMGVLLVSSELEEVVSACDDVTVLRDGVSVARVSLDRLSEESLMAVMASGEAVPPSEASSPDVPQKDKADD